MECGSSCPSGDCSGEGVARECLARGTAEGWCSVTASHKSHAMGHGVWGGAPAGPRSHHQPSLLLLSHRWMELLEEAVRNATRHPIAAPVLAHPPPPDAQEPAHQSPIPTRYSPWRPWSSQPRATCSLPPSSSSLCPLTLLLPPTWLSWRPRLKREGNTWLGSALFHRC